MNIPVKALFNNTYHVELIDASTGKVKQQGDFHNLTTNSLGVTLLGNTLDGTARSANAQNGLLFSIKVGSGTTVPTTTDTGLSSFLWSAVSTLQPLEWLDEHTARQTASVTFPASSQYVGTVTEVGTWSCYATNSGRYESAMCTRALLTDSEGQQISFDKTDTDILTVTVTIELSLDSTDDAFEIFKHPYFSYHKLRKGSDYIPNSFASIYGSINLCRFYYTLNNYDMLTHGSTLDQPVSAPSIVSSGNSSARSGYIQYNTGRLGTDTVTSERYFKGIAIPGIGFWKLPNENIFPAYTITGLNIGVGDGETASFMNPLCYFKNGTDKVYKNGVQLTRDVDYTINNLGNSKCLPEVAELTPPISIRSNATSSTTLRDWAPLIVPTTASVLGSGTRFFSNSNPLYIEYDEAVTFNCLASVGAWHSPSGTNGYNRIPDNTVFYIDYSIDGTVYEEAGQVTQAYYNSSFNIDFEAKTAKYWRIRTSYTGSIGLYVNYAAPEGYMTLNYKDPYIVFTEAPAAGDVLTMDVDMDIIMKNANFVVDVGAKIELTW